MKQIALMAVVAALYCGTSQARIDGLRASRGNGTEIMLQTSGASPRGAATPLARAPKAVWAITKAEVKAVVVKSLQRPGLGRALAEKSGIGGPFAEAFEEYVWSIYHDSRFIDAAADRLYARRDEVRDPQSAFRTGASTAGAVMKDLQVRGFSKLDNLDIRRYVYFLDAMTHQSTLEECGGIYSEAPREGLELKVLARLGIEPFREYLDLLKKAIFAGLDSDMPAVPISEAQLAQANAVFARDLEAEWRKIPASRLDAVTNAVQNQQGAQAADVCTAYQIILGVAYAMPGDEGAWFRRDFLVNSQSK